MRRCRSGFSRDLESTRATIYPIAAEAAPTEEARA